MTGSRFALAGIGMFGLCGFLLITFGMGAEKAAAPVVNDEQFHARLLKIAEIYPVYSRVDDEIRWAPLDCRLPPPAQPSFSRSSDEETHGRKLYSLFARGRDAYLATPKANPVGQIIVKESWVPQEIEGKPQAEISRKAEPPRAKERSKETPVPEDLAPLNARRRDGLPDHFQPFAEKEGKWYNASERGPLFIMMKFDTKTP
jgi:hypothetical protein